MSNFDIEPGVVLAVGGTNSRYGRANHGDIEQFTSIPTPGDIQNRFVGWVAEQVDAAANAGHSWLVAGYAGPVSSDGQVIGPMANVKCLEKTSIDIVEGIKKFDPAIRRLLEDDGFEFVNVNDGPLSAHAAAKRVGNNEYGSVAAFIIGTGVGAGIVRRDQSYEDVYHFDRAVPAEIGHIVLDPANPQRTVENMMSGPALERFYCKDGQKLADLEPDHIVWQELGQLAGVQTLNLALNHGFDLVVPCGGVGAGASDKFGDYLRKTLGGVAKHGNKTQQAYMPIVLTVPAEEAQVFELYGAEEIMRSRAAAGANSTLA